jgi:hypothetical protein
MAATASRASMSDSGYRRDLDGDLVLRWSAPDDVERVAALYSHVFRPNAEAPLNAHVPIWVGDMFSGRHPHIGPRDFAIVEDTRTGAVVASTCLLRYRVDYEGIPVGFGRPEIVASLPEYRHRGLIRAIFELIHARSEEQGDPLQGITGIPYYYRQFGYEYAAALDRRLTVFFPAIPPLKAGEQESYALRPATVAESPFLRRLWDRQRMGTILSTEIDEPYWRWLIEGAHPDALERLRPLLIVAADGSVAGSVLLSPGRWAASMDIGALTTAENVPLARMMPSLLRGLRALADTTRPIRSETPPPGGISFLLATSAIRDALNGIPFAEAPYTYAWYLRVPDLSGFIRTIAPVLERRLAESPQAGYSGELTLDFYRGGLRLAFDQGRLTAAEDWRKPAWGSGKAGFPPLVFLQLLFGYRDLGELRDFFSDVWAEGEADQTLRALFPKRTSALIPLD